MQIAAHNLDIPTTPAREPGRASFSCPGLLALADGSVFAGAMR